MCSTNVPTEQSACYNWFCWTTPCVVILFIYQHFFTEMRRLIQLSAQSDTGMKSYGAGKLSRPASGSGPAVRQAYEALVSMRAR